MFTALFAWSWTGHGQLTAMGVTFAVAQFLILASKALLKRFLEIDAIIMAKQTGEGDLSPLRKDRREESETVRGLRDKPEQAIPAAVAGRVVARLLSDLPGRVQREDLHAGNVPSLGEKLERDSQVRHFMRSRPDVTPKAAFDASTKYIRENCLASWRAFRRAVRPEKSWTDFFSDPTVGDFAEGKAMLAKALHAIEDSYAPGHVKRRLGNGMIESVNIWDEENKTPAGDWPGHEALDNPHSALSMPFFEMAKRTTGDFILVILANLDGEESAFLKAFDNLMADRFTFAPLGPGDFPTDRSGTRTG